jgi:4-amino-4-deoxy-L-arabinose transferase-like glycosyltransferase
MVVDDEAYYLIYARHLAWGYIDHGPVIGWMIKLTTTLFGENGFGIRAGGVTMITILAIVLYRFGKKHFNTPTGVMLSLTIMVNMLTHVNSIVMTPDVPLAFFGILAVMMYYLAFFENRRHFLIAGALLGFALLSKISALFPAAALFLFPIVSREHRGFLKDPYFYLSFVVALTVLAPFIIWNMLNDFAFFRYQGSNVARAGNLKSFVELWTGLALVLGPFFFFYAFVVPFRTLWRKIEGETWQLFFGLVAVVPLLYFIAHSFFSRLELNWAAPAFIGGVFLFGIILGTSWPRLRWILAWQMGYSLLLIFAVTLQTYKPWLPINERNDVTNRYYEYNSFRDKLPSLLREHSEGSVRRIAGNNYQIPSMINLYSEQPLEAVCLSIGYHETIYGFHYPDSTLIGEDLILVIEGEEIPAHLQKHFESHTQLGLIESKRDEKIVRTYSVWLADDYRGKLSL